MCIIILVYARKQRTGCIWAHTQRRRISRTTELCAISLSMLHTLTNTYTHTNIRIIASEFSRNNPLTLYTSTRVPERARIKDSISKRVPARSISELWSIAGNYYSSDTLHTSLSYILPWWLVRSDGVCGVFFRRCTALRENFRRTLYCVGVWYVFVAWRWREISEFLCYDDDAWIFVFVGMNDAVGFSLPCFEISAWLSTCTLYK